DVGKHVGAHAPTLANRNGKIMLIFWFVVLFVIGAAVGSFLNVCVYRLPYEKSLLWPGSHCGNCYQPVRWYDNLPLVSYWLLRGRCRTCGIRFSFRYFFIELLTGLSFAGLFFLELQLNVLHLPALKDAAIQIEYRWWPPWQGL